MPLQRLLHEGQRRLLVPGLRDVAFENLTIVVDRSPEVDHLAVQLHVHLVQVPAPVAEAPLTRCRRISPANIGPNLFHHVRTVL